MAGASIITDTGIIKGKYYGFLPGVPVAIVTSIRGGGNGLTLLIGLDEEVRDGWIILRHSDTQSIASLL